MSRSDGYRIGGVEPAHVMAVLKAIRDADNNTCAAAQRVLDMQTATMSHEALAEIASIASELLPDLRRELAVAQKPAARDHAIN